MNHIRAKEYPALFKDKSECCGCSACYSICSVNAITMQADEEGFLYPVVNFEKCICCYKCLKVCAFKEAQNIRRKEGKL